MMLRCEQPGCGRVVPDQVMQRVPLSVERFRYLCGTCYRRWLAGAEYEAYKREPQLEVGR